MQVYNSLQTDNHASTPPLKFFYRPDALPATQSTASKHWNQYLYKATVNIHAVHTFLHWPLTLSWPSILTVYGHDHTHAKNQGKRSVCSEDRTKLNDRWAKPIALSSLPMQLIKMPKTESDKWYSQVTREIYTNRLAPSSTCSGYSPIKNNAAFYHNPRQYTHSHYRLACVSCHPQLRTGRFYYQMTWHMLLLVASSNSH